VGHGRGAAEKLTAPVRADLPSNPSAVTRNVRGLSTAAAIRSLSGSGQRAGGQTSSPSHVPLKSVSAVGPGLAAPAPRLAGGQNSSPSHVPLKSVLPVGPRLARGTGLEAGTGVGPAATVPVALPVTDGGRAATDGAGAGRGGGVELAAAGGGSCRDGAIPGDEPVGGAFGALPEHPPANKANATATATTMLRIGPSPRGRSAISRSCLLEATAATALSPNDKAWATWSEVSARPATPAEATGGRARSSSSARGQPYKGQQITGRALAETIRRDLTERLTGQNAPYNQIFTTNGIACTTATVIAAALGVTDLDSIDDTDRIRRAHLLLAMFNALQPGVFALSDWDLCGMLTLPPAGVGELIEGGDTRWIHRAAHDLMGINPHATHSTAGMPRGRAASTAAIPEQLADESSFLRQLQTVLRVRSRYGIATSRQVDIPKVSHPGMLVMVHQLADPRQHQLTVLNFANEHIVGTVRSKALPPASRVSNMFDGKDFATVDNLHAFVVEMQPHHGMSLLVEALDDGGFH
jgi:hypothetical protein